ncbi:CBS domain-containing protein [Marinihelvus fidelis]|uniref:Magnesium and cobalt efflux protein CorC n=1 Tax=Marinihelvus fidelis TaxID=2613842 RepID=A0A5N0TCR6_9GAMM|nr:transporter associated domain-containing protein [Marinihelvus fidelis]KAA9132468.1 CBS domain-containing protein [Marinihelvus fidelis]
MSDDQSSSGSGRVGFLERLSRAFQAEPRDRVELKEVLNESLQRGVLDPDSLAMMEGALEVAETQVRDAMVPRSHMVVVPRDMPLQAFLPRILESGHSRFPVIGEDRDEVEGVLLAKDLLRYFADSDKPFELGEFIRPALVVPESKHLNLLLRDFRLSRNHLAIVVDEYGGVSGLITMEDVLEEIVGEIDDEHDEEEAAPVTTLGDNRYRVNALTPIDEFNEVFHCQLPDEEFDTVGGLLLAEFGRVPEDGESMILDDRFEFRVTDSDSRRIISMEMNVLERTPLAS